MSTEVLSLNRESPLKEAFLIPIHDADPTPIPIGEFLTLGRDTHNQMRINDSFISGRHARIEKKADFYLLRDLQSRNGTYLNGSQVFEAALNSGDVVRFGQKEFFFQNHIHPARQTQKLRSKNEKWERQLQSLPIFAQTQLPVLLLGPSGTGKEVLARAIHSHSIRSQGPFVGVNCGALSESLVESELFGHVKGSYTGATHDRKGAFEAARGGTLFLDEVGDLPLSLQPKLLRALENQEIRPVGSDKTLSTDVRIVAATHQDLHHKIRQGLFRADLFFRLHVVKVEIPALRDRPEDFEDLLNTFAKEMRVAFSVAAIHNLKKHKWPGNIRELKTAVARASAFFPGVRIQEEHVPNLIDTFLYEAQPAPVPRITSDGNELPLIKELEREMIIQRLVANRGNQRQTAVDLNMPKSTLHDRIRAYGIRIEEIVN